MSQQAAMLRDRIIEKEFSRMNPEQFRAVVHADGPLLILAGAGSGKTTVLVNRIACLIKYGRAYKSTEFSRPVTQEDEEMLRAYLDGDESLYGAIADILALDAPRPWEIMAITFTNKAAGELKSRLEGMLGERGRDVWASTFHSSCVRILRRDADKTGYTSHFTIYDTQDQKRVIKECQRLLDIDDKILPYRVIMKEISSAKDSLVTPDEYIDENCRDPKLSLVGRAYKKYQELLRNADAMDFDDLIVNAVRLLRDNTEVRDYYRRHIRYLLVDEYQDTDHAQYLLTSLIAGGSGNICVVGDDDQSIYRFRGATIENILSFENQYKDAMVIRLEQNYRSTQNILDAANAVIANNTQRKGKHLWTDNPQGDRILDREFSSDIEEGEFVAKDILDETSGGRKYSDFAVLYRMNAQSNIIEQSLVRHSIPYRIVGGHRFYERKEVRDILAYLTVIDNNNDNIRLQRIINEPKRGIGDTTVENAVSIADALGMSVFEVISHARDYPSLTRAAAKLTAFCDLIVSLSARAESLRLTELFDLVLEETDYLEALRRDPSSFDDRVANLDELRNNMKRYEDENGGEATLEGFLEETSLISDIDELDDGEDSVVLMTLHAAKGLEFPQVYIVGMENGVFPNRQAILNVADLEEERRLAYVGITRARERLVLTHARTRMLHGQTSYNKPSQFVTEIPMRLKDTGRPADFVRGFGSSSFGNDPSDSSFYQPRTPGKMYAEKTDFKPKKKSGANVVFRAGDTIKHKKFGTGLVLSVEPMGTDSLIEVAFDSVGTKKLMAKMAPIEKI